MVGNSLSVVVAEDYLRLPRVEELEDEHRGEQQVVAHVGVVEVEQVGVFVAHREAACRRGGEHLVAARHGLADGAQVVLAVAGGLVDAAVGDLGHSAAPLAVEQPDAPAQRVEHLHQVLAELRVVVVDIAAVEIRHEFVEALLLLLGLAAEPRLEPHRRVLGERATAVDLQHLVHQEFHRLEAEREVHHRGHARGHAAHEVGVAEHRVAQRGPRVGVFDAGGLDDVADLDVVGAGHLAPLAVEAVFQRLVVEIGPLEAVSLAVGTGLLRAGVVGIDGRDGAVDRADGALYARLEIVVA